MAGRRSVSAAATALPSGTGNDDVRCRLAPAGADRALGARWADGWRSGDASSRRVFRTQPPARPETSTKLTVHVIGQALGCAMSRTSDPKITGRAVRRSEEHTSELQSLMRSSYAVFCLKKKKTNHTQTK